MKRYLYLLLTWFLIGVSFCWGAQLRAEECSLLAAFRAKPLDFVSLTSLSLEEVLARWSDALRPLLEQGMSTPPENRQLEIVAAVRAERVLRKGWPLPADFDVSLKKELREAGYPALMVGESLGVLAFENPLPEENVKKILLEQLIISALLNEPEGAPLLFPCWDAVGMALGYGEIEIEGKVYHAAVLVVVFAVAEDSSFKVVGRVLKKEKDRLIPIGGALVKAAPLWGWTVGETFSFADGSYCIEGLRPGEFIIWAAEEALSSEKHYCFLSLDPCYLDLVFPKN